MVSSFKENLKIKLQKAQNKYICINIYIYESYSCEIKCGIFIPLIF